MAAVIDGSRARELLRLIRDELGSGESFTASDLLYSAQGNLALEDCIERCIRGRVRVNRSLKRRARIAVNAKALGQYLSTIVGRRYRFLRLEGHHGNKWTYTLANYRPMGRRQIKKLLAVRRIEIQPTVASLKKAGKALEREEKERAKGKWNFEVFKAHAAQAQATPRDRRGRIIEPTPAPAPAPAPRIGRPARPCKFGGTGGPGTYSDGRRKCCGRRHD